VSHEEYVNKQCIDGWTTDGPMCNISPTVESNYVTCSECSFPRLV